MFCPCFSTFFHLAALWNLVVECLDTELKNTSRSSCMYVCMYVGMVCLRKLCPYHCSCLEYSCILDRYIWCIAVTAPRIVDVVTRGSEEVAVLFGCLTCCRIAAP